MRFHERSDMLLGITLRFGATAINPGADHIMSRSVAKLAILVLIALLGSIGCTQRPVAISPTMKMTQYLQLGPIRDSPTPTLVFPVFDLFTPNGELVYHGHSLPEVQGFLHDPAIPMRQKPDFLGETLAHFAGRYPDLRLPMDKLLGRYTLLFISAPGCHACEAQDQPLHKADLPRHNVNEISLTLAM